MTSITALLRKKIRLLSFLSLVILLFLTSCEQQSAYKTEINQVFGVKSTSDGFVAGSLLYQDSIVYQSENLPQVKFVFEADLTMKGQENYPITKEKGLIQSNYLSSTGESLSYYKYELNEILQKERSEAYDASNDELLRVEEMSYNPKNELSTRKIFTSAGQLATSYSFIYDGYGNEIRKITQHLLRDTIITEESRITKYFADKTWNEKWGFINDKPIAFYKRTIKVH